MIGLYYADSSPIHRIGAGWKLLLLAAAVVVVFALRQPWQIGAALCGVALLYAAARIPGGAAWTQLRPITWVVPLVVGFQLIFASWQAAIISAGMLLVNVALAALVTLTTRVSDILDVCRRGLRPLRRFGVDPDRVGLLLALTVRCVPLVAGIVGEVVQARKARGVSGVRNGLVALAAPAVVRALRTADALGEALRARGVDDD